MYGSRVYQEQAQSAWFRIDLLLALYDATIKRLEAALWRPPAEGRRRGPDAPGEIAAALGGAVSAVDPGRGEMATRFLSLYGYVNYALDVADVKHVEGAVRRVADIARCAGSHPAGGDGAGAQRPDSPGRCRADGAADGVTGLITPRPSFPLRSRDKIANSRDSSGR